MMLVYRICIPCIAIFGIVGNILNIIVLRFSSEIIMIITMRMLTMVVVVFVINAYLFNLSQSQFKDSVYFFLKVATASFSWSWLATTCTRGWTGLKKCFSNHSWPVSSTQCLALADLGYLIVAIVTSVFVGIPPYSEHSFIVSFLLKRFWYVQLFAVELWDGCFRSLWPRTALEQHDRSFRLCCHLHDHQQGTFKCLKYPMIQNLFSRNVQWSPLMFLPNCEEFVLPAGC